MALIFSSYFQDSSIISPFPEHSHLTLSIGKASDMRAIKSLPILPLLFPLLSEFRIYPFPNPQYDSNELYPFIIFKSFFVYSTRALVYLLPFLLVASFYPFRNFDFKIHNQIYICSIFYLTVWELSFLALP